MQFCLPRPGRERSRAQRPIYLVSALVCAAHGCGRVGFDRFGQDESNVGTRDGGALDAGSADGASGFDDDSGARDAAMPGQDGSIGDIDGSLPDGGGMVVPDDAGLPDAAANDASTPGPDGSIGEDAGEPDASIPDPDGFCAPFQATALACSDFSSLPENFSIKERNGRVTLANGVLNVRTTSAGGAASVVADIIPVFTGPLYARFLLRVPQSAPIVALNMFALGEPADLTPSDEFDVNLLDTSHIELFSLSTQSRFTSSPGAFQRGTFQCVEVWLDVGASNGSIRVRVGDRTVINASPLDTRLDFGVVRANLGIDYASPGQPATTLEFDDFLLATERLAPCP
jgi:hypothetical protein